MLLHNLALAHFSLGRYESAAHHLLEHIARNPDTAVAGCWRLVTVI
jgi:hypothetical protein